MVIRIKAQASADSDSNGSAGTGGEEEGDSSRLDGNRFIKNFTVKCGAQITGIIMVGWSVDLQVYNVSRHLRRVISYSKKSKKIKNST